MTSVLIQVSFWVFNVESDQYHEAGAALFFRILSVGTESLSIPWPILYETVSTRFVKNRPAMNLMQNDWKASCG